MDANISSHREEMRVFEAGESNKILGVLEVLVPYVLFRGLAMCADVATTCNQSFIERST
jgi:hypothetical protein